MSLTLPNVSLSALTVNTSTSISFQNMGIGGGGVSANPALTRTYGTLRMHNESGTGLLVQMQTSGDGYNLPAGGWADLPVKAGEQGIKITALYILAAPPVQVLLLTYFFPNESVPPMTILGNSPIGGTTTTTANAVFFLGSPFLLINNISIAAAASNNYTCTGVGGIPTGATGVLIAFFFGGAGQAGGSYITFTPQGATWSQANYPASGQQGANGVILGAVMVPVNTTNGQITVGAVNQQANGINAQIYGYIF